MGVLLALASSVAYGLSDFLGGLLSRRTSFVRVALLGQIGGLVSLAVVAPLIPTTALTPVDLAWGGLSGVGTGMAMMFLFRGMTRGAISVVVPVSAVGGVTLPVLIGVLALGDRPPLLAWTGIALAVPALWSVSRGRTTDDRPAGAAVPDGLVSGTGIALQYLALAQASPESGIWPVVAGRVTAVVTVAVLHHALQLSAPSGHPGHSRTRFDLGAALAGTLAGIALVCYLLATRTELITIAVVLSSLYPAIPVLLGITLLRERLTPQQTTGLAGAVAACLLITAT